MIQLVRWFALESSQVQNWIKSCFSAVLKGNDSPPFTLASDIPRAAGPCQATDQVPPKIIWFLFWKPKNIYSFGCPCGLDYKPENQNIFNKHSDVKSRIIGRESKIYSEMFIWFQVEKMWRNTFPGSFFCKYKEGPRTIDVEHPFWTSVGLSQPPIASVITRR